MGESPTGSEGEVPAELAVEEFGDLVAKMARFLATLSTIPQFRDADLGLAEWVALSVLQQGDGINNKQLASRLGVTRQRAHQVIAELAKMGWISVQVSQVDSRENVLSLTVKGREHLKAVNVQLGALLSATLGPKVRGLGRLQQQVAQLMRVVHAAKLAQARSVRPAVEAMPAAAGAAERGGPAVRFPSLGGAGRWAFKPGG
jgi:DNA-binding MarR family transcriptional regulator